MHFYPIKYLIKIVWKCRVSVFLDFLPTMTSRLEQIEEDNFCCCLWKNAFSQNRVTLEVLDKQSIV